MVDIFLFIPAVISTGNNFGNVSIMQTQKTRTLVTSLALQQVKEVGTVKQKEINTECKILTCISLA